MRQDEVPLRNSGFDNRDDSSGLNSEGDPTAFSDVLRGSRVTPVAPAVDPTDPLASAGPLTLPPSWFPADELDTTGTVATRPEPLGDLDLSYQALDALVDLGTPRPRDTVPSPPPCLEEFEAVEQARSEQRPKSS